MKAFSTIVIMNHVLRKREGLALKKILESETRGLGIDVQISYDDGSLKVWKNYKQALTLPSKEEERWRFIMHDDMYFNRKALEKMLHVLNYASYDDLVSFYNPSNKGYRECYAKRHHVLKTYSNFWLQCHLTPTHLIKDFLRWTKENIDESYKWEDRRVSEYLKNNNVSMYAIVPSLSQHLGAYRSTLKIAGKIGKVTRESDLYDPEFDVYGVDWIKEFNSPYVNNVHTQDKNLVEAKRIAEETYGI